MTRHLSGRASLGLLLTILALAVVLGGTLARADDLNLGGTFNSFNFYNNGVLTAEGGGSLVTSSLTSVTLGFVYCVDINDNITVPGDYNNTIVTNNGNVNGAMVNNAGQVAWLLDNYAVGAEGNANATDQIALQAAIWHVIYGANYYLDPSQTAANTVYLADLAALGTNTAPVSNYYWFSPLKVGDPTGQVDQGLIGGPVPEPASVALLGGLLLFVTNRLRKRFVA